MLYPLYLETREKKGAVELMLTSVRHWHSMGGRQGYSLTGASSLSSAFGRGDQIPRLSLTPVAAEEQQGNPFGLR